MNFTKEQADWINREGEILERAIKASTGTALPLRIDMAILNMLIKIANVEIEAENNKK